MLTGFHHLTLRVTDLDRSRTFYSALPGFALDQDFPDLASCAIGSARPERGWFCVRPCPAASGIRSTSTGSGSITSPWVWQVVARHSTSSRRAFAPSGLRQTESTWIAPAIWP